MPTRATPVVLLLALSAAAPAQVLPPVEKEPQLRVEAGGPTAFVTALAFAPDGKRLYAAGLDKVVRAWDRDADGKYQLVEKRAYRVPIGPGLVGSVNAIAVSPDGKWLAVGGMGVFRGMAGFRQPGFIWPIGGAITPEMWEDQGLIYVFNTADDSVKLLRGHRGAVLSLTFAGGDGKPMLVSAARELDAAERGFTGGLRLWDVDKGGDPVGRATGLPATLVRPGLTAWRTAGGDVRAAVAWDDGSFRVWHTANGVKPAADEKFNITAAATAGGRVLTAGYGAGSVRLKAWEVGADGDARLTAGSVPRGDSDTVPRALVAIPPAGGRPDLAAVVAQVNGTPTAYRLFLVDAGGASFGTVRAERPLWTGQARQPAVAAAPTGDYLAVAGNGDHTIQVYRVADLVAGRGGPQELRSAGAEFRSVAFIKKGDARGLVLGGTAKDKPGAAARGPADGDLIFDATKRQVTDDRAGWGLDAAGPGDWRAVPTTVGDRQALVVSEGGRERSTVKLAKGHVLQDYALLPPRPPLDLPLLAVASHENGQPRLVLHNARTGEQLRHLTGHVERVHAVAFSADGLLLASAGQDQTVAVWALKNLDKVVGQFGQVPGVAVKKGDRDAVVIDTVADDSPARDALRPGDGVVGIVDGDNNVRAFERPLAFYEVLAGLKPKADVRLRVRRGGAERDVAVTLGQAIDERKPLFTLFVTRGGDGKAREWIGWNPLGPYNSSGQQADRLLGWHRNTGEAAAPAGFALAGEYRGQFFKEGVVARMLARGELPPDPGPRLPPPRMTLNVDDGGQPPRADGEGVFPVRRAEVTLRVAVDRDRPLRTLKEITWRVGDGPEQPFDLTAAEGQEVSAAVRLPRGKHTLHVTARGGDGEDAYPARPLLARYQPPAPAVRLKVPLDVPRPVVRVPAYTVEALVKPGAAGEAAVARLLHHHADGVEKTEPRPVDELLTEKLTLRPGDNTVEIEAYHRDAPEAHRAGETGVLKFTVNYKKNDDAPVVALKRLVPVSPLAADTEPRAVGRDAIVVDTPQVRVEGEITAKADLTAADWTAGGAAQRLKSFERNKQTLAVAELIDLKPGVQTIRVTARTETSDAGADVVTVEYRPRLPAVELDAPAKPKLVAGTDPRELKVTGRVLKTDNNHPFIATILVNGAKVDAAVTIADGTLTATVKLGFGPNQLQVRLENQWGGAAVHGDAQVRYVRRPTVGRWLPDGVVRTSRTDVTAEVASEIPLVADSVRATVNGRAVDAPEIVNPDPAAPTVWRVRLKEVIFDKGKNDLTLSVANAEDRSDEGSHTVEYDPPSPPRVVILGPAVDGTLYESAVAFRFRVQARAADPLTKLRIVREGGVGRPQWDETLDPAKLARDGADYLADGVKVPLLEGVNAVRVEASTDGGDHFAVRSITYVSTPVKLTDLELVPRGGQSIKAETTDGKLRFPKVAGGRARLKGKVVITGAGDRLTRPEFVRVFVNGFQHLPARLRPAADGGRAFEVEVLLNARDNQIELALPGLPKEFNARTSMAVACASPELAQRLHVFIVSADDGNADDLKKQFLAAFKAKPRGDGLAAPPAFDHVYVYEPKVGYYARRTFVNNELEIIKSKIKGFHNAGGAVNDVVLFYFKGGESVDDNGNLFRTAGQGEPLTLDWLVGRFADTPGAHVLLFDVDRQGQSAGAKDKLRDWQNYNADVGDHVAVVRRLMLGGDAVPGGFQLLNALEKALPEASRLLDVTDHIRRVIIAVQPPQGQVVFDRWVPPTGLGNALIGARQ